MGNMANLQFFILLGTVLAGVIWQRVGEHHLSGRIDRMSDDLKLFYRDLGRHEKAIEILERKG
jgi:hypothetical protein